MTQLTALIVSNYSKVFDELIELKNYTNFEIIFKQKRGQKEYIELWNRNVVRRKYKPYKNMPTFLQQYSYLCETSYSKLKYAKNMH